MHQSGHIALHPSHLMPSNMPNSLPGNRGGVMREEVGEMGDVARAFSAGGRRAVAPAAHTHAHTHTHTHTHLGGSLQPQLPHRHVLSLASPVTPPPHHHHHHHHTHTHTYTYTPTACFPSLEATNYACVTRVECIH
jgi:hypothetical protein